jgi:tRNA-specific 2-thiouridylase
VDCNRYIKFGRLLRRARELSCDYLATGHYARISRDKISGRLLLRKAADARKDQSYFLYAMSQEELAATLFPLGGLTKEETRRIAARQGFANAGKRESQDICFAPGGDYAAFIERYRGAPAPPGDFIDAAGRVIGRHKGLIHYTVGQRKGLGQAFGRPRYVSALSGAGNTVTLGEKEELYASGLVAKSLNLIACSSLPRPLRVRAKTRYRQAEEWAIVEQIGPDEAEVTFDAPQKALTAGQSVVFYDGDVVVGGGTIAAVRR